METEYRLCLMGTDDNPDYSEVVNSRAVSWIDALPYINLPLNSQKGSPISSIMAGPRLRNWDTQLPPIKDYLNTLGVPDDSVSIRRSKIKLRF